MIPAVGFVGHAAVAQGVEQTVANRGKGLTRSKRDTALRKKGQVVHVPAHMRSAPRRSR